MAWLTIDINFLPPAQTRDDANWDPADHPKAKSGEHGGQFVKKGGGEGGGAKVAPKASAASFGKAQAALRVMHGLGNKLMNAESSEDLEKATEALKAEAAKYKSPYAMGYANQLFSHAEMTHGLKAGSLGKAKAAPGKSTGTEHAVVGAVAAKTLSQGTPAKQYTPGEFPFPENPTQQSMWEIATHYVPESAIKQLQEYDVLGTNNPPYKEKLIAILSKKLSASELKTLHEIIALNAPTAGPAAKSKVVLPVQSPGTPSAKAKGPEPHPDSPGQKAISEAAAKEGTNAEKIAAVKVEMEKQPKGGYTEKFGNEWLAALGDKPAVAKAEAAKPKTATSPRATKMLERMEKAYDPQKFGHDKLSAILTATKDGNAWQENFTAAQRAAVTNYSGGGYGPINEQLRDMSQDHGAGVIAKINAIDAAFDHDDAAVPEDLVLRRGLDIPAGKLAKWRAGLEKNLPVRMSQKGFISASYGSGFSNSVKLEILVRKGTPALHVKPISQHAHENEVLLRHGQAFEVLSMQQVGAQHVIRVVTV